VSWQVQQSIDVGHRDPFWTVGNFYDVITRTNFSFLQHAKIESWSPVCDKQGWHPRLVHADAHAVAGNARLCHFKHRVANAVSIANADFVIGKSFNSEILSELAESKITAPKDALPIMVRIHLVDKYGALLSTMTGEIGLPITIDVHLTHHPSPLNGKLPDRCSHSLAVPCHFARKADIH
jgi:hypothetical protein